MKEDKEKANELDLFRAVITGFKIEDVFFAEKLEGDDRRDFCTYCYDVYKNKFFSFIFDNLFYNELMRMSVGAETENDLRFSRATFNGITLFRDLIAKYAREYEEKYRPRGNEEKFDPYQSFQPTKGIG